MVMGDQGRSESVAEERRIAQTGGLARFAGACAHHPWRVVLGWLGVFVVLIGLNVAFHGTLINDFKIPGSDTQKATDLINAKFGGQRGAALRVVVAAPPGQRLDTPERVAAIEKMLAVGTSAQKSIDQHAKDVSQITNPISPSAHQLSADGRIGFYDVQFDQTGFELKRSSILKVEDQLRAIGTPAGIQVEFTGDAENAPPTQGLSDIIGLVAAFIILMVLFRALVPTVIPLAVRDRGGDRRVSDLVFGGAVYPLQHDYRDPGADDRPGRRYRLHAVHRHPLPTVLTRRAITAGRRGRRGRDGRAGGHLRRHDGRDLDHRPGADRT